MITGHPELLWLLDVQCCVVLVSAFWESTGTAPGISINKQNNMQWAFTVVRLHCSTIVIESCKYLNFRTLCTTYIQIQLLLALGALYKALFSVPFACALARITVQHQWTFLSTRRQWDASLWDFAKWAHGAVLTSSTDWRSACCLLFHSKFSASRKPCESIPTPTMTRVCYYLFLVVLYRFFNILHALLLLSYIFPKNSENHMNSLTIKD